MFSCEVPFTLNMYLNVLYLFYRVGLEAGADVAVNPIKGGSLSHYPSISTSISTFTITFTTSLLFFLFLSFSTCRDSFKLSVFVKVSRVEKVEMTSYFLFPSLTFFYQTVLYFGQQP